MNTPESRGDVPTIEIRPEFVGMALLPTAGAYVSMGDADPVSRILYKNMVDSNTSKAMIDFIDVAEDFLDTSGDVYPIDVEQEKVARIIAFVRDMPTSISEENRLKVWGHLFRSAQTVGVSALGFLDKTLRHVSETQSELRDRLVSELSDAIEAHFNEIMNTLGHPIVTEELDILGILELSDEVKEKCPELSYILDAVFTLQQARNELIR